MKKRSNKGFTLVEMLVVMGIIGLANAVFQLACRDHRVGWTPESLVDRVSRGRTEWAVFRERAIACLEESRAAIRQDDLMGEIGSDVDTFRMVQRLETLAHEQGKARKERLIPIAKSFHTVAQLRVHIDLSLPTSLTTAFQAWQHASTTSSTVL